MADASSAWLVDNTATPLNNRNDMAAGLMEDRATKDIGAAGESQGNVDRGHPLEDGPKDSASAGDAADGHIIPSLPGPCLWSTPLSGGT